MKMGVAAFVYSQSSFAWQMAAIEIEGDLFKANDNSETSFFFLSN